MKTFQIYRNGTEQGTVQAKNLREAKGLVFSQYGKQLEVCEIESKRNTVRKNKNGDYSLIGLNKSEKESLRLQREYMLNYVGKDVVDSYILCLYDNESNEVYFVNESTSSCDERAEYI